MSDVREGFLISDDERLADQFKDERGEQMSRERERALRSLNNLKTFARTGEWKTEKISARSKVTFYARIKGESPTQEIRRLKAIVNHYVHLSDAGREWLRSWLEARKP